MSAHPHASPSRSDASTSDRTLFDDDSTYDDGRLSGELSEGDHDILESEDERERLLTAQNEGIKGMFGKKGVRIGKLGRKNGEMKMRTAKGMMAGSEEESALMYEMEEGIGEEGSEESEDVSGLAERLQRKAAKRRLYRKLCIYTSIIVLFVVLLSLAYRASTPKDVKDAALMQSNGTSLFAPITILISLDGFRADFLYRNLTPTLNQFIQEGISPKYMLPSFPSVTFPNHYTMATGMYPEAHGVVGNTFWDPKLEKEFYYTDPTRSLQPYWWGGEPIWVTAEKQKVRAAVHMWPGSEAHVQDQQIAYVDKYNGSEILPMKVRRIMELLDTPGPKDVGAKADTPRPQLIAAYVPNVDGDGHRYGPNSTEIRATIAAADSMIGDILAGLHARNLTNIVNVVVVSDHGMATTDSSRLIQLESLVDPAELSHIDGWPLYGLRPKNPADLHKLYNQIKQRTKDNPNVEVYLRDENMPERYHFSKNERIAPLWIVPKAGWAIVDKNEYDVEEGRKKGEIYHPRGLHGYDHEHPLMRAIFVARGPAFKHRPGSRMEAFQNIELYNIICDSLHLTPAPNNGTLRLPLTPVGHHSDDTEQTTPDDPPTHSLPTVPFATPALASQIASASSLLDTMSSIAASASGMDGNLPAGAGEDVPVRPTPPSVTATPGEDAEKSGGGDEDKQSDEGHTGWWDWITHKADEVEEWVEDFIHSHVPGQDQKDGEKKDR